MAYDLISENDETTVVAQYDNSYAAGERKYVSEKKLEDDFINQLQDQQYEYVTLTTEDELIKNLRKQIERLNKVTFNDSEWKRFFNENIAKPNAGVVEKTRILQEDPRFTFTFDDGNIANISLLDKKNIHENHLQVMRQYTPTGGRYPNRYDVTILVNGLPMVHVELKKPGVDIREAFNQIKRYNRDSFWADNGLFEFVQIYVISNGTYTKYYSNTTRDLRLKEEDEKQRKGQVVSNSFEFTSWWTDANNKKIAMLEDFTSTFFAKHTLLNILTRFCVFTVDKNLMVMRPYQIAATEKILNRINCAYNAKKYGSKEAGGYIWHTTGSGKTLTSFKTSILASRLPYIDKVLFVVDRKDLDYQTMKEYDNFQKDAANSNKSVAVLEAQLKDPTCKIIITTIQKLSILVNRKQNLDVFNQQVVMIFDECHRSQFGEMHTDIIKKFKKYYLFGFTGTPIFADNVNTSGKPNLSTTQDVFGDRLHTYNIINAIQDKNVLPFRMEYVRTMRARDGVEEEMVDDIDREKIMRDPRYIGNIVSYILKNFEKKTKRNSSYQVKEQRLRGFNSIFATASIEMAKLYYKEFKRQMEYLPEDKRLKVAMIYSFSANGEDPLDGDLGDENSDDPTMLNVSDREALEECIRDYNAMFGSNYSTDAKQFGNYYKDVSKKMKNRELDLLIVVNMFLTGFDAKTLNTLWVDKNLKMHGLLQAYSRTNRILNSVKTFGNIVCFRNLERATNEAIGLFGNSDAKGIVLLRTFEEYYNGYTDDEGKYHEGYKEMVEKLLAKFPIGEEIKGEEAKKEFVKMYSYIMKLYNILTTFDAFEGKEILSESDRQHMASTYIEIYNEFKVTKDGNAENVNDDIVFEMELIKQDEISIDRILWLITEYAKNHLMDKEIVVKIKNAINASPDLRNKKDLIENFIASITAGSDVDEAWSKYVREQKEAELNKIIEEEHLKTIETHNFMEIAFRKGYISMSGTAFSQILPAMLRFGQKGIREKKRQDVYAKLSAYLEKYKGLGDDESDAEDDGNFPEIPQPDHSAKQATIQHEATADEHIKTDGIEIAESLPADNDAVDSMTAVSAEASSSNYIVGKNGCVKALSIYQPWAQMLASGISNLENRNWSTKDRGTFLIVASKKMKWHDLDPIARNEYLKYYIRGVLPEYDKLPTYAIVGKADLEDVAVDFLKCKNLNGYNPTYKNHFIVGNPEVLNEPMKYHTGKFLYETDIRPEDVPASHDALSNKK